MSKKKDARKGKKNKKVAERKAKVATLDDLKSGPGTLVYSEAVGAESQGGVASYDAWLLSNASRQWQFGDWDGLTELSREELQSHPDRAKLALLAAAGHLQCGSNHAAREFIAVALEWGCNKKLVSQILIAGVHNSLGRATLASGLDQPALGHFENSVRIAMPVSDKALISEARAVREAAKLGLLPQAVKLMGSQISSIKDGNGNDRARITILETELELLHHELSLAQQRRQIFRPAGTASVVDKEMSPGEWIELLKQRSVSQLGQDIWVLGKTGLKRGGFFVEFGATDGVLLSNTWLLEAEFGWEGVCAEPNPKFYSQLTGNRKCQVSNQYIGRETGQTVEFILADAYGGSREFADDDHHKGKRDAYAAAGHVATFTAISLDEFLEQHNAPRDIDYISIDTEGSEYDLLSTFPFEKWNVYLFTIEHNFAEQRGKIRGLLESHGYRCTEQQWDDWYEKIV